VTRLYFTGDPENVTESGKCIYCRGVGTNSGVECARCAGSGYVTVSVPRELAGSPLAQAAAQVLERKP